MFGVPAETEFDLRFRLLGIPVRVHPLFWVFTVILGWELSKGGGKLLLIWVACVFFSILVHEFGHALVARAFGAEPSVLLHSMGGLCLYQHKSESLWQRFFVLAMGPGAGFLLMGATIAWGSVQFRASPLDVWRGEFIVGASYYAWVTIRFLVWINFFWGLINLLPVMPLDGGQIATVFLTMHNHRQGQRRAYILSLVTGGLAALYFVQEKEYYAALLFGLLALSSFQVLQALHYQARAGAFEDDADWWKR